MQRGDSVPPLNGASARMLGSVMAKRALPRLSPYAPVPLAGNGEPLLGIFRDCIVGGNRELGDSVPPLDGASARMLGSAMAKRALPRLSPYAPVPLAGNGEPLLGVFRDCIVGGNREFLGAVFGDSGIYCPSRWDFWGAFLNFMLDFRLVYCDIIACKVF